MNTRICVRSNADVIEAAQLLSRYRYGILAFYPIINAENRSYAYDNASDHAFYRGPFEYVVCKANYITRTRNTPLEERYSLNRIVRNGDLFAQHRQQLAEMRANGTSEEFVRYEYYICGGGPFVNTAETHAGTFFGEIDERRMREILERASFLEVWSGDGPFDDGKLTVDPRITTFDDLCNVITVVSGDGQQRVRRRRSRKN